MAKRIEIKVTVIESLEVPDDKYEEIKRALERGEVRDRFDLMDRTGTEYEMEYDTIEILNPEPMLKVEPVIRLIDDEEVVLESSGFDMSFVE